MPEQAADTRLSYGDALRAAAGRLAEAGIPRPQAEARLLLEAASGVARAEIIGFPERLLPAPQAAAMATMVARRCAREPVSRILGRREFWSLSFRVTPATLDPRPDSETLVSAVLERIADRSAPCTIVDFGTGTGCLLLALLSELPNATGLGIDISAEAVATARDNAAALGLAGRARLEECDWARDIGAALGAARFDIAISNPPYVESDAIPALEPEVARHDPRRALDGGPDGLDAYRVLIPRARQVLKPGGVLALEIGAGQSEPVRALAIGAGFTAAGTARDLAGIPRCVLFLA